MCPTYIEHIVVYNVIVTVGRYNWNPSDVFIVVADQTVGDVTLGHIV